MKRLRLAMATLALLPSLGARSNARVLEARRSAQAGDPSDPTDPTDPAAVERQLGRLASTRALEREAAQAYLALHLERRHLPLVAAAASRGGAEVQRRLALALGSQDEHLGLASLLYDDRDPEVREVGREAIHELLFRWSPSIGDPAMGNRVLPDEWVEEDTQLLRLQPMPEDFLACLDRFARLGGGPVPIILSPSMLEEEERARGDLSMRPLVGDWDEILSGLMQDHRLSFQLHGYREDGEGQAWLRIAKLGDRSELDGEHHFLRWVRGVLREQNPERNRACARALAASGWPAAIAWFEEGWLEERGEAALEGLLEAAVRGHVAPTLALAREFRAVLAVADQRAPLDTGREFVERVARALAQVGPTASDGSSLSALLLESSAALPPSARWMRLVILEGQRDPAPAVRALLKRVLETDELPVLQFQALRVLARLARSPEPVTLARPERLARWVLETEQLEEFTHLLREAEPRVRALDWIEALPESEALGCALALWGLTSAQGELAEAGLRMALDARPEGPPAVHDALELGLSRLCAFGLEEPVRAQLEALREGGPSERAARARELWWRMGLASEEQARALLERLVVEESLELRAGAPTSALFDLAALSARVGIGWKARTALVNALEGEGDDGLYLSACELALEALRGARMDAEGRNLVERLRSQASRTSHALAPILWQDSWPPAALPLPLELDQLERSWRP